jgi:SWI/SNF-related matrix-associated actin-dependent regulator of chromatin subfamily B protein 1
LNALLDPVVSPEHFAQTVVEDYNLSSNYHSVITKSIQEQLSDFKAHSNSYDGEGGGFFPPEDTLQLGTLDEGQAAWWEAWRKRLRPEREPGAAPGKHQRRRTRESLMELEDEKAKLPEELTTGDSSAPEDMRILIKVRHREIDSRGWYPDCCSAA